MLNWQPVACRVIIILWAQPSRHSPGVSTDSCICWGSAGGTWGRSGPDCRPPQSCTKHSGRHKEFKMEYKFLSLAGHCILWSSGKLETLNAFSSQFFLFFPWHLFLRLTLICEVKCRRDFKITYSSQIQWRAGAKGWRLPVFASTKSLRCSAEYDDQQSTEPLRLIVSFFINFHRLTWSCWFMNLENVG